MCRKRLERMNVELIFPSIPVLEREMRWFQKCCPLCEIPWRGRRQERPGGYRLGQMVLVPLCSTGTPLDLTPHTHNRIKGWTSGKRRDWCCDPGPTTPSPHILISWYFLLDRPGMPLFVCLGLSGMPNYTISEGNIGLHHRSDFLFACISNSGGGKLSASPRWTKKLLCGWSEVVLSGLYYAVMALLPVFHTLCLCLLPLMG